MNIEQSHLIHTWIGTIQNLSTVLVEKYIISAHTSTFRTYAPQNTKPRLLDHILIYSNAQCMFMFNLYLGLIHGDTFKSCVKKLVDPWSI